jgi:hypothetical protein
MHAFSLRVYLYTHNWLKTPVLTPTCGYNLSDWVYWLYMGIQNTCFGPGQGSVMLATGRPVQSQGQSFWA